MGTSLIDAANSEYVELQNSLRSSAHLPEVIIYVEGWADVPFWTECVRPYMHKFRFSIEVFKHPDGTIVDGKRHLMDNVRASTLGPHLMLAVDADYDWIIDNYRPSATLPSLSPEICSNPYVLHTYLYSIENYKCHAACLPGLISKATAVTPTYECMAYMTEYSKAVAKLFLIHLVSADLVDGVYPLQRFIQDIDRVRLDFEPRIVLSQKSKKFIETRLADLDDYITVNQDRIQYYADKLHAFGFDEENYYLLFKGHCVADTMVRNRFKALIRKMRLTRIRAIQANPDVQQAIQHITNYSTITGISEANTAPEIEKRMVQLINDCTEIHKAVEGYNYLKADLDRLFP